MLTSRSQSNPLVFNPPCEGGLNHPVPKDGILLKVGDVCV